MLSVVCPSVESSEDTNAWHRTFAVAAFNRSWDLLDKPDRSAADDAELLATVFASRYHWEPIGNDENKIVGDWQIAHAASHLGLANVALTFATLALERAQAVGRTDWMLASCYEGMARAHAVLGTCRNAIATSLSREACSRPSTMPRIAS